MKKNIMGRFILVLTFFLITQLVAGCKFKNKTDMDNILPLCTTLLQLKENSGKRVTIQGVYRHPKNRRLDQMKIILTDGNAVVLNTTDGKMGIFAATNSGKKIVLVAKFYDGQLPEKYEIESRTDSPIIVDIEQAGLVQ